MSQRLLHPEAFGQVVRMDSRFGLRQSLGEGFEPVTLDADHRSHGCNENYASHVLVEVDHGHAHRQRGLRRCRLWPRLWFYGGYAAREMRWLYYSCQAMLEAAGFAHISCPVLVYYLWCSAQSFRLQTNDLSAASHYRIIFAYRGFGCLLRLTNNEGRRMKDARALPGPGQPRGPHGQI